MAGETAYADVLRWGISVVVPAASGLVGVVLGALLAGRRDKSQRRQDFVVRQLKDFYSPLLAIRKHVQVLGELRCRVFDAQNKAWQEECARFEGNPEAMNRFLKEREPEITKNIEYENKKHVEESLPAYRNMITIFRNNLWLAEANTVAHFPALLEFVELWDIWMARAIMPEAMKSFDHTEEKLLPPYEDLQRRHDELRQRLATGQT